MKQWTKGKPQEPGNYWVFYDRAIYIIEVDTMDDKLIYWIIGGEFPHSIGHLPTTHYMNIEKPKTP